MKSKDRVDSDAASRILGMASMSQAFLFFTDVGKYTGEFALCLRGFYEKLDDIPLESIEFHFNRRDYEKWIREILGDNDLAATISRINKSMAGEELRKTIKKTVGTRLHSLEDATLKRVSGIGPKWSKRLKASGVNSVEELVKNTPEKLSDKVGVPQKIASKWIKNARQVI